MTYMIKDIGQIAVLFIAIEKYSISMNVEYPTTEIMKQPFA